MGIIVKNCFVDSSGKEPALRLAKPLHHKRTVFDHRTKQVKLAQGENSTFLVRFPSRGFDVALSIISHVYQAVRTDTVITKRELYYRDVALFRSQKTVDKFLLRLTETLRVPR